MKNQRIETSAELLKAMSEIYAGALSRPSAIAGAYYDFATNFMQAMLGQSDISPERGDKRFADPMWQSNPLYKSLMQSYLSWAKGMNSWADDLNVGERNKLRVKLVTSLLTDSLAPTNMLAGNPQALKATLDSGGRNLLQGAQHFIKDMVENEGLPSMVDMSAFKVGENLGTTEGRVVYREEHLELIQYAPKTETVFKRPVFIVPPQINKFYIWDLAHKRSVVEYLLDKGHQIFIVSWRNPTSAHARWGMDSYVAALDRASAVACELSKSPDLNIVGACSGGTTSALLLAYWSAKKINRANSFTLLVAVLDTAGAKDTTMGLFANLETLEVAKLFSRTKGMIGGRDLQKAFAWLRPNDLIWAYWVNNYLLGKEPAAFDILYWNADTTNLPSDFHSDLLAIFEQGGLNRDNGWKVNGVEVNISQVECDKFLVAGTTDHITPWEGCYLATRSFGGKNEFVLSKSGHIQAIINPPGNPKSAYLINSGDHATPEEFLASAEERSGTWWDHWAIWLEERSGKRITAPKALGSDKHPPMDAAPGLYVKDAA